MTTIYLVMAQTGEYGDAHDWAVKAFHKEQDAVEMVEEANRTIKKIIFGSSWNDVYCTVGSEDLKEVRELLQSEMEKLDPKFHFDYNGVLYFYISVPAKLRS